MSKTILTVDDSASVRQMVSFTLRNAGYVVVEALDGRDFSSSSWPDISTWVLQKGVTAIYEAGSVEPLTMVLRKKYLLREKVLSSLVHHLRPGGYLFKGHSETLNGFCLPVVPIALTVYRKTG